MMKRSLIAQSNLEIRNIDCGLKMKWGWILTSICSDVRPSNVNEARHGFGLDSHFIFLLSQTFQGVGTQRFVQ